MKCGNTFIMAIACIFSQSWLIILQMIKTSLKYKYFNEGVALWIIRCLKQTRFGLLDVCEPKHKHWTNRSPWHLASTICAITTSADAVLGHLSTYTQTQWDATTLSLSTASSTASVTTTVAADSSLKAWLCGTVRKVVGASAERFLYKWWRFLI